MKLTKKSLLLALKENLTEMPMTFDTDDRPADDITRDLANRETNLKKVPLPKDVEAPNSNFEEMLASARYKQIVANLSRYAGINAGTGERNLHQIMGLMTQTQAQIAQIESTHKPELERLAVELAMSQLGVIEGDIEYDAKITSGMSGVDPEGFKKTPSNEPNIEEVEIETELFDELSHLNLERAKRRLINAMMQGASERGHYMYHLVEERIREITGSDRLLSLYGIVMSTADTMYWQMSNNTLQMLTGGSDGEPQAGGKESVDLNSNPPKVTARAINFPILVHELVKGTMEVVAGLYGQPEDADAAEKVRDLEDTVDKEIWDLRLGPAIWDIMRSQFPEDVLTDEDKVGLQLVLFQHIVKKPAREFLIFMKEVISGSENGKRLMNQLMDGINQMVNDYDYEEAMSAFDEDLTDTSEGIDDDDLDDWLGSIGVTRSDD